MKNLLVVVFSSVVVLTASAKNWKVVLPADPKPWEVTAAAELEEYVGRRIGGHTFTVEGQACPVLHVGDSAFAREKGLTSDKIENERWLVKSFGRDVVINGGGSHGALYATYHFLEDLLDVRWWGENEESILRFGRLQLNKLDLTGKPRYFYRDIYRSMDGGYSSSRLAIRRRLNRNGDVRVPVALGGAFCYGNPAHAHTFNMYIPWETYGKDHPEWFSLVKGKRHGGGGYETGGQFCFANSAGFRQIFLDKMLKYIEEDAKLAEGAGVPPPEFYEISMNDNEKYCECPTCAELAKQYGKSGVYLRFVNDIAGEIAKRYPRIFITMLAYFFTEEAPKGGVKPADNVIVKLCNTRGNMTTSILHPDNHAMRELTAAWQPLAKNIFIWDYDITYDYTKDRSINTTGYPFPSELHYADKFRFYLEHGITGIFWEHEEQDRSDLFDLKYYLKTKLFEDPYCDYEKLLRDSFNEYFGPKAGPHVLAARRRLAEAQAAHKGHVRWFPQLSSFNYIHGEDAEFMLNEYAEAEKVANWIEARRIRRAKSGLERLMQRRTPLTNRQGPDAKRPARLPPPKGFEGRSFWDFYATDFLLYDKSEKNVVRVDEPSSPVGKSVKIVFDDKLYKMPFLSAYYDYATKDTRGIFNITQEQVKPDTWKWYPCGKFEATDNGVIYLTPQWTVQIPLPTPDFAGKKYKIALHANFSGKTVRIDRMILIDTKE